MEIKFTEQNLRKLEEIKSHYPTKDAALMPALWIAQEQFGWISIDVMKYIGDLLNIPYEHIYGVVKFYTMYNKSPVGKYHIQVCTNISCMLRGSYDILDYISKKLNIKTGETTEDKLFTLSEVECLGSCGTAPMMQVNNYYKEDLTKELIDKIIADLKNSN
jgi:NADH-quinone oxidoreductase E subunit